MILKSSLSVGILVRATELLTNMNTTNANRLQSEGVKDLYLLPLNSNIEIKPDNNPNSRNNFQVSEAGGMGGEQDYYGGGDMTGMAGRPQQMPGAAGQPGGYPGGQPGGYSGQPGGQPGGYPGGQPGGQPGGYAGQPGGQPGGYAGQPGGYPGGQPGGQPGGYAGQPGGYAGQPGGQPGQYPGGQPGGYAGQPGGQPGQYPGGQPGQYPGQHAPPIGQGAYPHQQPPHHFNHPGNYPNGPNHPGQGGGPQQGGQYPGQYNGGYPQNGPMYDPYGNGPGNYDYSGYGQEPNEHPHHKGLLSHLKPHMPHFSLPKFGRHHDKGNEHPNPNMHREPPGMYNPYGPPPKHLGNMPTPRNENIDDEDPSMLAKELNKALKNFRSTKENLDDEINKIYRWMIITDADISALAHILKTRYGRLHKMYEKYKHSVDHKQPTQSEYLDELLIALKKTQFYEETFMKRVNRRKAIMSKMGNTNIVPN